MIWKGLPSLMKRSLSMVKVGSWAAGQPRRRARETSTSIVSAVQCNIMAAEEVIRHSPELRCKPDQGCKGNVTSYREVCSIPNPMACRILLWPWCHNVGGLSRWRRVETQLECSHPAPTRPSLAEPVSAFSAFYHATHTVTPPTLLRTALLDRLQATRQARSFSNSSSTAS